MPNVKGICETASVCIHLAWKCLLCVSCACMDIIEYVTTFCFQNVFVPFIDIIFVQLQPHHSRRWFWNSNGSKPMLSEDKKPQRNTAIKVCQSFFLFPLPVSFLPVISFLDPALNLDRVSSCQRSVSCFCSCWVRFYSTSSGKQCLSKKHFKRLQHLVALSTKKVFLISGDPLFFFWSASFGENVWLQREVVMFKNHFQMFLKMIRMSKVIKYAKIIILIAKWHATLPL